LRKGCCFARAHIIAGGHGIPMVVILISIVFFSFLSVWIYKGGQLLDNTHYTICSIIGAAVTPLIVSTLAFGDHFLVTHSSIFAGAMAGCMAYDLAAELV
jgi:hypothetical protein